MPETKAGTSAGRALYEDAARFLHAQGWRREELGSGWWWREGFEDGTLGDALQQELRSLGIDMRDTVPGEPEREYWG